MVSCLIRVRVITNCEKQLKIEGFFLSDKGFQNETVSGFRPKGKSFQARELMI